MDLPFDPEREPLDVGRIMGAIREQNRLDRERGILTEEELDAVAQQRIRRLAETPAA